MCKACDDLKKQRTREAYEAMRLKAIEDGKKVAKLIAKKSVKPDHVEVCFKCPVDDSRCTMSNSLCSGCFCLDCDPDHPLCEENKELMSGGE